MIFEDKINVFVSKGTNDYVAIVISSVSEVLKIRESDVGMNSRLYDFGMSSMDAFKLQTLLEDKTGLGISGEIFSDLELDVNGLVDELQRCSSKI